MLLVPETELEISYLISSIVCPSASVWPVAFVHMGVLSGAVANIFGQSILWDGHWNLIKMTRTFIILFWILLFNEHQIPQLNYSQDNHYHITLNPQYVHTFKLLQARSSIHLETKKLLIIVAPAQMLHNLKEIMFLLVCATKVVNDQILFWVHTATLA